MKENNKFFNFRFTEEEKEDMEVAFQRRWDLASQSNNRKRMSICWEQAVRLILSKFITQPKVYLEDTTKTGAGRYIAFEITGFKEYATAITKVNPYRDDISLVLITADLFRTCKFLGKQEWLKKTEGRR